MPDIAHPFAILRRKQVENITGLSRSTIYLRVSQGLWTKPVSLGPRAVGWPAKEIDALNAARIAGKGEDEIREIVGALERARVNAIGDVRLATP
jgi:prophage regulatory protein